MNWEGANARTNSLAGLSPLKQSTDYKAQQNNKNQGEEPWYKDDDPKSGYGTGSSKVMDRFQDVLDIGGFIPGIGVGLDLLNAGISGFRGDYDRMIYSGIAAVPGLDYVAAGAKGVSKVNKARKGLKIPFTNTKVAKPSTLNPLKRFQTNPVASSIETLAGVDYANSRFNPLAKDMGLDENRESYSEKVLMPVVNKGVELYSNIPGEGFWNKTGNVAKTMAFGGPAGPWALNQMIKRNKQKTSNKQPVNTSNNDNKSVKPTGANRNEKLRKAQEERGYFRDK